NPAHTRHGHQFRLVSRRHRRHQQRRARRRRHRRARRGPQSRQVLGLLRTIAQQHWSSTMKRAYLVILLLSLLPAAAHAADDSWFGLGNGRDGAWPPVGPSPAPPYEPLPVPSPGNNIINDYTTLVGESAGGT